MDQEKKKGILSKAISLGKALLAGEDVGEEALAKRIEICGACDLVKIDHFGNMNCGVCGCKLTGSKALINLARYEETTDYGCKHPEGSQWKKNGV